MGILAQTSTLGYIEEAKKAIYDSFAEGFNKDLPRID
jgi:hypothetical protein